MPLVIDDGYTLPFETLPTLADPISGRVLAENLPPVIGRYRPALFSELEEYQYKMSRASSGQELAELTGQMIAAHVTDWDVVLDEKGEKKAPVAADIVLKMPGPIVRQLIDVVTTWAPKEQEKAAGNSPAASGSPS